MSRRQSLAEPWTKLSLLGCRGRLHSCPEHRRAINSREQGNWKEPWEESWWLSPKFVEAWRISDMAGKKGLQWEKLCLSIPQHCRGAGDGNKVRGEGESDGGTKRTPPGPSPSSHGSITPAVPAAGLGLGLFVAAQTARPCTAQLLAATRMETPSCWQPSSGAAALNQADLCPLLSHSYFLKSLGVGASQRV